MHTPDRVPQQDTEAMVAQPSPEQGANVTQDSPLPNVPDAGDHPQPVVPPTPPDISSGTLFGEGAVVASTLDDGDDRTLYEQTLDAQAESEQEDTGGRLNDEG
jgi:hypothetical protein